MIHRLTLSRISLEPLPNAESTSTEILREKSCN